MYKKRTNRRRTYRRRSNMKTRMNRSKKLLHNVKKFVCSYKLMDIESAKVGTYVDKYSRNALSVKFSDLPIVQPLSELYRQYAITGVKFEYRPLNTSPYANWDSGTIVFAENKGDPVARVVQLTTSEDNCRQLSTTKPFKHYVKNPRPYLLQAVGVDGIPTIQSANQIQWFNTNDAKSRDVPHLCAQMNVSQSNQNSTGNVLQGELWVKVYVVCKEQQTTQNTGDSNVTVTV